MWLVECNVAGYRISRWAEKRRHLIAPDPRSFIPRELEPPGHARAAT